jgi:TATA-box binding protein (TBP) (component of TFIID and TFIIIB)
MDDILNSHIDIDSAWSTFCEDGNIDNNYLNDLKELSEKDIPKATEIYISTKTKIAYLNNPIDLNTLFWKIDVIPYHKLEEGVVKKQMKFNFSDEESVQEMSKKLKNEKNVDEHIISRIINPNGRIKFRDIRKISIGLSQKDITSYRSKKRSAFYNCFVLLLRINQNEIYKEIHVKVFNTGKLEIPGIRDDSTLITTLDILVNILRKYSDDESINYDLSKSETVLINSNFNCGFYLNRDKLLDILKYKYKIDCVFDACQYPGIQCKYNYVNNSVTYKLSFMIFRTGSILIVGKCEEDVLFKVYNYIKQILDDEYLDINVINTDTVKSTSKLPNKKSKKRIIYVS